jgi:hypothetical protein
LSWLERPFPIQSHVGFFTAQHVYHIIIPRKDTDLFGVKRTGVLQADRFLELKPVEAQIILYNLIEIQHKQAGLISQYNHFSKRIRKI